MAKLSALLKRLELLYYLMLILCILDKIFKLLFFSWKIVTSLAFNFPVKKKNVLGRYMFIYEPIFQKYCGTFLNEGSTKYW